jgi:pyruvate kinase
VETFGRSSLVWGVSACCPDAFEGDIDDAVAEVMASLKDLGAVAGGDSRVLTAGLPFSTAARRTCCASSSSRLRGFQLRA